MESGERMTNMCIWDESFNSGNDSEGQSEGHAAFLVSGRALKKWLTNGRPVGCQYQLWVPDAKGEDAEFEKKTSCWCDGAAGERRIGTLCRRGLGLLVQITNQLLKLWCSAVAAHGNYLEVSKLPVPGSHPQKTWWFWGMDWASEFLQSRWVILVSSQN